MPIKIACQCGQGFQAPDNLAGKKVRCPKCGNPLSIPAANRQPPAGQKPAAASAMGSLLDDIGVEATPSGGKRCPNCNAVMAGHAIFCVECGLDLETKEVVEQTQARSRSGDDAPKIKSFGNPLLDKAARELEYDKREKTISQDPRSWYSYFIGLMLCIVFVTVGAIISLKLEAKEDKVASDLPEPGLAAFWGVFAIGVMVIVYPWGQITSTAFKKAGPLHGCLCLTCVYCPAIAFMFWGELKRPFFMWVFGFILLAGSYGTYYYYTGEMPESLI
jgi:ribosomal protein S27AE